MTTFISSVNRADQGSNCSRTEYTCSQLLCSQLGWQAVEVGTLWIPWCRRQRTPGLVRSANAKYHLSWSSYGCPENRIVNLKAKLALARVKQSAARPQREFSITQ